MEFRIFENKIACHGDTRNGQIVTVFVVSHDDIYLFFIQSTNFQCHQYQQISAGVSMRCLHQFR